jgi:hypothetical protein
MLREKWYVVHRGSHAVRMIMFVATKLAARKEPSVAESRWSEEERG